MDWIDLRNQKPDHNKRILVCDENGYVDIENTEDAAWHRKRNEANFETFWESSNGTKLVAWMPLPDFPAALCRDDADGEMPR